MKKKKNEVERERINENCDILKPLTFPFKKIFPEAVSTIYPEEAEYYCLCLPPPLFPGERGTSGFPTFATLS